MKAFLFLALLGTSAVAAPVCAPGQFITTQAMTCAQAKVFAKTHHYQNKSYLGEVFMCDGEPMVVYLDDQNCPGNSFAAPLTEPTLDDADCVVGLFCHQYPNG